MLAGMTGVRALLEREQIIGLATDHATARAADELLRGDGWGATGRVALDSADGRHLLWAEFTDPRRSATITTVTVPDMRATCSCAATRFPCRHVVALLLRDLDTPFQMATSPDWLSSNVQYLVKSPPGAADSEQVDREMAVISGMADLRLWLHDLAREGLAGLPKRGRGAWLAPANRLEDAYALEAARELRELAVIPGSGTDWPERLLPRLGRLALLCEAFARLDELSPGERGDALAAAGHLPRIEAARVADEWVVLGRATEVENRTIRARTWLHGRSSGRWAKLDESCAAGRLEGVCLPTGAMAAGELAFLPSAFPLIARPVEPLRVVSGDGAVPPTVHTIFDAAMKDYSAALAANPWLRRFPLAACDVFIEPPTSSGSRWRLRDREGRLLPLPPNFSHGWRLLSLAAGRTLDLFGEWDGATFIPMSVYNDGWLSLAAWRAVT